MPVAISPSPVDDARDAAARLGDPEHLAALVDGQPVALGRPDERLDGEDRIREPRRRLVARERDPVEPELGPAALDVVGLDQRRVDAEAPLDGNDVAQRLLPLGRREQQVADLLEAGGAPELLFRVREHRRAADGEPDPDLVRVVLSHVRGRVLRRPAADRPLLDQRDLPDPQLRQEMGGARPHDPGPDHHRIGLLDHARLLSSRRAAVAAASAVPSGRITTPYCSRAASTLTFSFATSTATTSGSRSYGSPQPPPPAVRWA